MLNLNDAFYFVQVVDSKGFAAASRTLNVPKSSLSRRLKVLEDQLGARLLQCTSRTFAVTDAGWDFYRHASAMLIEAQAAENAVKARLGEPHGTVRLTCSGATAHSGLLELFPAFAQSYSKVKIVQHSTNRVVDVLREGFDVAIRAHPEPLRDCDLIQRRLGHSPRVLVAAPQYLRGCGTPATPAELAQRDGLVLTIASGVSSWVLTAPSGATVTVMPRPAFMSDDLLAIRSMAVAGTGIASLPRALCREHLASGSLVRVLPEWRAGGADISMLWARRRGQLPCVRVFIDFIASALPRQMQLDAGPVPIAPQTPAIASR
jgi:DNA-binding transcriptional LysR family regulator